MEDLGGEFAFVKAPIGVREKVPRRISASAFMSQASIESLTSACEHRASTLLDFTSVVIQYFHMLINTDPFQGGRKSISSSKAAGN